MIGVASLYCGNCWMFFYKRHEKFIVYKLVVIRDWIPSTKFIHSNNFRQTYSHTKWKFTWCLEDITLFYTIIFIYVLDNFIVYSLPHSINILIQTFNLLIYFLFFFYWNNSNSFFFLLMIDDLYYAKTCYKVWLMFMCMY